MELISNVLIVFGCIFLLISIMIFTMAHLDIEFNKNYPFEVESDRQIKKNSKKLSIISLVIIISGFIAKLIF